MSTEDAIDLVTKMTIEPTDMIVVRLREDVGYGEARDVARAFHAQYERFPILARVPIIVAREDLDIAKLDEREARQLYDVLRKRFEGSK